MAEDGWIAYHLHYHEDRDRVVRRVVGPLVRRLLAEVSIDRFFFVRYLLGGPHLRLRLHTLPGAGPRVVAAVERTFIAFVAAFPSTSPMPEEVIRRHNRSLLSVDGETDDAVYPDNFFRRAPVHLETERYGGHALLPASLDLFSLSSVEAVRQVEEWGEDARARRLGTAAAILARQACGLARTPGEVPELLDYSPAIHSSAVTVLSAEGDRLYERRREPLLRLIAGAPQHGGALTRASRLLARMVANAAPAGHRRIAASHLHMTANRLGLDNLEEVYVGRALSLAAREWLGDAPPARWPAEAPAASAGDLRELIERELREWAAAGPAACSVRGRDR